MPSESHSGLTPLAGGLTKPLLISILKAANAEIGYGIGSATQQT
jgi:hypothetical protein